MKNLAIIPARSGSKGLKDKNILPLAGKPLLAYSIEAALASGQFDEVMVSTDSPRYAQISEDWGAKVPFLRSAETSTDTASSWDMVDEVLAMYRERGREFDSFCLLQPTSPLRTAEDITEAYRIFREQASVAVISVCESEHTPLWAGQLPESHELDGFIDPDRIRRRQANGTFYRLNGAIFIADIRRYHEDRFLYRKGSYAYIMKQSRSIDIDGELDFRLAEFFLAF